jgi:hypothetical protein
VVRLVNIFANQLTPAEVQTWLALAGYQLDPMELEKLFPGCLIEPSLPTLSPRQPQTNFKQLELLPAAHRLFGVGKQQQMLRRLLEQPKAPWLAAIDGIGGIGKTALASMLVHEIMGDGQFYDVAWVSAKQEEFRPSVGLQAINQPALTVDILVNHLLEQLASKIPPVSTSQEKLTVLVHLLKQRPYLIIIDNLETVVDYQTLLPLLRNLVNPSKCLLTSRRNLQAYSDVFCLNLQELNQADAIDFLSNEAEVRGIAELTEASRFQLDSIYKVVGGNPLALKLVVGQISYFSLSQVLENLTQARGKKAEDLYRFIYWQVWQALDPASRETLLAMPLAKGGTFDQLTALNDFGLKILVQTLELLISLSLVEVRGGLEQRRYYIHRLTETFLLTDIVNWESSS